MREIIGHRGAPSVCPENTCASFRKAKQLGAGWIECDLRAAEDGHPYILHDRDLDRTTNGTGPLHLKSRAELDRLDAGSWFDPRFADQTLPDLPRVLDLAVAIGLKVNLEIKDSQPLAPLAFAERCVGMIRERPALPPPLISSFDSIYLEAFASCASWPVMLLVKDALPKTFTTPFVGIHVDLLPRLLPHLAQTSGTARWVVWGLDRAEDLARCQSPAPDIDIWGVITDHPAQVAG